MRTKLLRALAHLKAAKAHISEARRILDAGYMTATSVSVSAVQPTMDSVIKIVQTQYGYECYRAVEPAELP